MIENLPSVDRISDSFCLKGQTALVTGGASGLGQAISWGLACFGANVVIADINIDPARQLAERLAKDTKSGALALRVDVGVPSEVEDTVGNAIGRFGFVNILVNCAGGNCRKPFLEMGIAEFDAIMAAHVRGTMLFTKAVLPSMIGRGGGSIINIASIMGLVAMENISAYCAAKGGIIQFTKALAVEFAAMNVRVNAIAPGFHHTALTRQHSDETRRRLEAIAPMKRFAGAEEIIGPAVFLSSRASSFVTGTVLVSDGGWTAV